MILLYCDIILFISIVILVQLMLTLASVHNNHSHQTIISSHVEITMIMIVTITLNIMHTLWFPLLYSNKCWQVRSEILRLH